MNAVFIRIPKTAGTYTMTVLGVENLARPRWVKEWFQNTGRVSFGHQDYPLLIRQGIVKKEFDESAFKFCFCRNPFDRAVSHYFYTMAWYPDVIPRDTKFIDFTRNLATTRTPRRLRRDSRIAGNCWVRPQSDSIAGIKIDFIGRFERLQEDIRNVADILGVPVGGAGKPGATKRASYWRKVADILGTSAGGAREMGATSRAPYWRTYYNDEAEENVRQYYAVDFERFGYDDRIQARKGEGHARL